MPLGDTIETRLQDSATVKKNEENQQTISAAKIRRQRPGVAEH
jgi:hypothetical protein